MIDRERDRRVLHRPVQRRVGVVGKRLEQREVGQRSNRTARQDDGLAADFVGQGAEHDKERCTDQQGCGNQQVSRHRIDLERLREEKQRVELPRVPDHGLASHQTQQGEDDVLQIAPARKRLGQRCLGRLAIGLHFDEGRRLVELESNPDRYGEQGDGHEERHTPAPGVERVFAQQRARAENDQQRQEQPQRGRGLNPRGVGAALVGRRVFSDIGGGAAVFPAERQALQQTQCDENDRCSRADGRIVGQHADDERRQTHDQNGDEEGVFAADHVAQPTEQQSAKRSHDEACGKRQQREDERRSRIQSSEELLGDDGRQRAVEVEVVPLEYRAER